MTPTLLYVITCLVTGKMYVGITGQSLQRRWTEHQACVKKHPKIKFYACIGKYGVPAFEVIGLFTYPTRAAALSAEIDLIAALDLQRSGLNSTPGGDESPSMYPEISARSGNTRRGRKLSTEHRVRQSEGRMGMKFSPTHRVNIGLAQIGRAASDETKARMAKAQRDRRWLEAILKVNSEGFSL